MVRSSHPSQEGCGGKGSYDGGGQKGGVGGRWQRRIGDSSSYYKGDRDNNEGEEKYGRAPPPTKNSTINLTMARIQILLLKVNNISMVHILAIYDIFSGIKVKTLENDSTFGPNNRE